MLVAGLFLSPFSVNGARVREGALVCVPVASVRTPVHAGTMAVFLDFQTIPFVILGASLWLCRSYGWRLVAPARHTRAPLHACERR
jgi:hypothetical protein